MIASLSTNEESSAGLAMSSSSVGQSAGLLSLAGDALCLAVTALRLSEPTKKTSSPAIVSLEEVAWHDNIADCWIVLYDRVYDITSFLSEHPGGEEILVEYAGRDATLAFNGIGHGAAMLQVLDKYLVGVLPESEHIFSRQEGKLGILKLTALLN
ncbi:uncharacterized protein [Anabrus simplex]|uniref:uncharacterized protein n=1 Tax=Anabrus simplex TaxID=316456 RepID=UPI0035A322EE